MDERQKMTNYMMGGHHEGLWTLKVKILLFFLHLDVRVYLYVICF